MTAEDRLGALLDAAVDPMVLIDTRGLITRFNPAAERVFGYRAAEVLGQNVSMLMPAPYREEHDGYIARYQATGEPRIIGIGREVTAQRRDGSRFPIDLAVGEFRSGSEQGFVGILRDISERKEQERQLRENAEALQRMFSEAEELRARLTHAGRLGTLGEMVSGIAHEVNQPLTAIASYASACRRMLQSGQIVPAELAGVLDKISAQAERAGQVIRGLRTLARRQDNVHDTLDLNQLVRDVARLVGFEFRNAGWQLQLQLSPELPPVIGDGVQIQQVVLNLLRNALEAMQESAGGNSVELVTEHCSGGAQIRVSDRGPGLSATAQKHLFQPFYTTKPEGMGLGLSICKSIVAAHGGELCYEPRPGGGASFTIRLPAEER